MMSITRAVALVLLASSLLVAAPALAGSGRVVDPTRESDRAGVSRLVGADCPVRHRLDYQQNRFTIRFSGSCIGNPRSIRVAVQVEVSPSPRLAFIDRTEKRVLVRADAP